MSELLISLIRFYQKRLSKLKGRPTCRFTPTCSGYAIGAIREWGAFCGIILTVWRILRCNPISRGGYDPVPENRRRRKRLAKKAAKSAQLAAQTIDSKGICTQ